MAKRRPKALGHRGPRHWGPVPSKPGRPGFQHEDQSGPVYPGRSLRKVQQNVVSQISRVKGEKRPANPGFRGSEPQIRALEGSFVQTQDQVQLPRTAALHAPRVPGRDPRPRGRLRTRIQAQGHPGAVRGEAPEQVHAKDTQRERVEMAQNRRGLRRKIGLLASFVQQRI